MNFLIGFAIVLTSAALICYLGLVHNTTHVKSLKVGTFIAALSCLVVAFIGLNMIDPLFFNRYF